jgi:glycine cleavage system H protein
MADFLETTFDKFIFRVKEGYLYSRDDFWASLQGLTATIGATDFLQKANGDVTFLATVEPGTIVTRGGEMGRIETIKATSDIIAPASGKVLEVNPDMETSPHFINLDPYGRGWIYRIELTNPDADKASLLHAAAYFDLMKRKIEEEAKKLHG